MTSDIKDKLEKLLCLMECRLAEIDFPHLSEQQRNIKDKAILLAVCAVKLKTDILPYIGERLTYKQLGMINAIFTVCRDMHRDGFLNLHNLHQ